MDWCLGLLKRFSLNGCMGDGEFRGPKDLKVMYETLDEYIKMSRVQVLRNKVINLQFRYPECG